MINLKPKPILKSDINNTLITQGQLIYCTDTMEAYYDIENTSRVALSTTRQIATEAQRMSILSPKTILLYVILETNKVYRYSQASGWVLLSYYEECKDLIFNAQNLKPDVMRAGGINRAPMTLSTLVFNNDGSTVQDTLNTLFTEGKKITLEKKVRHVFIKYDTQRIVDIPYPTSDYDIYKYPVMVVLDKEYILPEKYALGSEQLIFCAEVGDTTKKGEMVTFIFAYCNINTDEGVNADSIDGRGFTIGPNPPAIKTDKCIWIDTLKGQIKEWHADTNEWQILFDNNAMTVQWQTNTIIETKSTTFVEIGIEGYNKNSDRLIVHLNSTHLDEGVDYTISGDNSCISTRNGAVWDITDINSKNYFSFLVLKNVPRLSIAGKVQDPNATPGTDPTAPSTGGGSDISTADFQKLVNQVASLAEGITNMDVSNQKTFKEISTSMTSVSDTIAAVKKTVDDQNNITVQN